MDFEQNENKCFIPTIVNALAEGRRIPIYGTGQNIRDWHGPFFRQRTPFLVSTRENRNAATIEKQLVVLPIPTTAMSKIAIWHTIGFIFGWDYLFQKLRDLLEEHPAFYYLIHPGDYLGPSDLPSDRTHYLERMDISLENKMARLEQALSLLANSGRLVKTMLEVAEYHYDKLTTCNVGSDFARS